MSSKNFDHTNAKNISHLCVITKSEWKNTSILQDRRTQIIYDIKPIAYFPNQILHFKP